MTTSPNRFDALLLFGAPGVGKGTQGKLLGQIPGFLHVASGDIFRSLDQESELGKTFLEYSSKGLLVPDELTIEMWHEFMLAKVENGTYRPQVQMLVLDGIPRNKKQAEMMDRYIVAHKVINLVAENDDELLKRMKRRAEQQGRLDDAKEEVIRNRFSVYHMETAPMLAHYDEDHHVSEVSAIGSPGRVLMNILNVVIPVQEQIFSNALEN